MTPTGSTVAAQPVSSRVMLAALAERVTTELPGVALTDGGNSRWQTVGSDRRIPGVTSVIEGGGRYELDLWLVVDWPPQPLGDLAEELRRRVAAAAADEGLGDQLGEINVTVVGVNEPGAQS